MNVSIIKGAWVLLKSKWVGLAIFLIVSFAEQVLAKIADRTEASVYCLDLIAITTCIKAILANHGVGLADEKRASLERIHDSLSVLSRSLSAGAPSSDDLRIFVNDAQRAIELWK